MLYNPPVYTPVAVFAVAPSYARKDAEITLSIEEASDFDKGLSALSEKLHAAFVVEGAPLKGKAEASNPLTGSAAEVVRRFADIYDYDVALFAPTPDGAVYTLRKRYSNPADLPCVTNAEYGAALNDAERMFRPFNPEPPFETAEKSLRQFVAALSPEEKRRGQAEGIPIGAMAQDARTPLWRLAINSWIGEESSGVASSRDNLQSHESAGRLRLADLSGVSTVMITELTPSGTVRTLEDGSIQKEITGHVQWEEALFPSGGASVSSPEAEVAATEFASRFQKRIEIAFSGAEPQSSVPRCRTLQQVTLGLNKNASAPKFEVDPVVAAKPVIVVGAIYASAERILQGLARTFDLELKRSGKGPSEILRLQRRVVPIPTSLQELAANAVRLFPPALLRAMRLLNEVKGKSQKARAGAERDALLIISPDLQSRTEFLMAAYRSYATTSINTEILRWQATNKQGKPLPYRMLSDDVKAAIAGYYCVRRLWSWTQKFNDQYRGLPPAYVTHFEEAVVTFKPGGPAGERLTFLKISAANAPQRLGVSSELTISDSN